MPTYQVTDSQTGKIYKITGSKPPTQEELVRLIGQKPKQGLGKTLVEIGKSVVGYGVKPLQYLTQASIGLGVGLGTLGKVGVAKLTKNRQMEQSAYDTANQFLAKQKQIAPEVYKASNPNATLGQTVTGGLKLGAGLSSYAVPGGGKWAGATTTAGKFGTAALSGGTQAGLREAFNPDASLESVGKSSAYGFGTAGILQLLGEGLGSLGKSGKLQSLGGRSKEQGLEKSITTRLGAIPTPKEGGMKLVKDMKSVGIDIKDPVKAVQNIEDITTNNANKIKSLATKVPEDLINPAKRNVIKALDEKIANAVTSIERDPLIKVRDKVITDLYGGAVEGQSKGITKAIDFYSVKQDYGRNSHWNITSDITGKEAEGYRIAYETMNEQLDNMLKSVGDSTFRNMNKQSHIAIKAGQYLTRSLGKLANRSDMSLTDWMALLAGYAKGGLPGALQTAVWKKIIQSPLGMNAKGGIEQGLGNISSPLGGIIKSPTTQKVTTGLVQQKFGRNK